MTALDDPSGEIVVNGRLQQNAIIPLAATNRETEPSTHPTTNLPHSAGNVKLSVMSDWRKYLRHDPKICHGQLCVNGTRVLVTNILDSLAEGATRKQILRSYPSLRPEHIDAAIGYAAELAREEALLPASTL